MLSNAYFLVKFRFDTAENEPAKKLQKFVNLQIFRETGSLVFYGVSFLYLVAGFLWVRAAGSLSA